jgi:hypothetical protein
MRKHNGMRPQDIVILLKIISLGRTPWQKKDLAQSLSISQSEVSEAMNRNYLAGLVDYSKKQVNREALLEFLEHGMHYAFPQAPGPLTNGIPTAHAHPLVKKQFDSEQLYVWPDIFGKVRGQAIEPLYPNQTKAVSIDEKLYKLLALVDVIRVGRARETSYAINELKKSILDEPYSKPAKN